MRTSVFALLACAASALAVPAGELERRAAPLLSPAAAVNVLKTCKAIAANISSASAVFYPGSVQYLQDIEHYSLTNTAASVCTFEPGTAQDVSNALKIIAANGAPWAVKSQGHLTIPLSSSTLGIQISMTRFKQVTLSADKSAATIGVGNAWNDVYKALDPSKVSVLGGRVPGVGVAGFSFGGGYGYRTNQVGLTIDTIQSYNLVLPNGTITTVTSANDDLFWIMRGGFNTAGIVTSFTLSTQSFTQVWGGINFYAPADTDGVLQACSAFDTGNTDVKASLLCNYIAIASTIKQVELIAFYDGPTPPAGVFDVFSKFTPLGGNQWKTFNGMNDLVSTVPSDALANLRTSYSSVSIQNFTPALATEIQAIAADWGAEYLLNSCVTAPGVMLNPRRGAVLNLNPEPFVASAMFAQSKGGVYPHEPSKPFKPIEINLAWTSPLADSYMYSFAKRIQDRLNAAAVKDGQQLGNLYGNYALGDTPLSQIYGDNVARAQAIAAAIDPNKVMCLNVGGFKFQRC